MTNSILYNNAAISFRELGDSRGVKSQTSNNSHSYDSVIQNESEKEDSLLCKRDLPTDVLSNFSIVSDKFSNLLSTSGVFIITPTTEDNLINSLTTAEKLSGLSEYSSNKENDCALPGFSFKRNRDCDVSIYANESKSYHLGRFQFQYTKPNFEGSSEKMRAGGGTGLSAGITIVHANPELKIGQLGDVDARIRVGVANVESNIEGKLHFDSLNPTKSGASIKGNLGAEALLGDTRYAMDIKITPKTVGDTLSGIYNNYIDTAVDYVAGYDVQELPRVPDEYDHGIVFSGHVTTGFGGAAKIGGELEIGDGKGFKLGAKAKLGLGPVLGIGLAVGVK
ncbi:MAG: hypothetical protein JAY90_20500 [Candidatus Thiodiazotropha lotti]|nr:hypothetical protein [Candidatus Thiodiazotropha lotti]